MGKVDTRFVRFNVVRVTEEMVSEIESMILFYNNFDLISL